MESSSRPPLLSPLVPRLPSASPAGSPDWAIPTEPCLRPDEYAEPPPPIHCDPLPPDVQQGLAAGQGMAAALRAYRQRSELAWCLAQLEQTNIPQQQRLQAEQQQQEQQQAAPAPAPEGQQPEAAAGAPKEQAALAPNIEGVQGEPASESEGPGVSEGAQMQSRASAVFQESPPPPPPPEPEPEGQAAEAGAAAGAEDGSDADLTAMLEQELAADAEVAPAELAPAERAAAAAAGVQGAAGKQATPLSAAQRRAARKGARAAAQARVVPGSNQDAAGVDEAGRRPAAKGADPVVDAQAAAAAGAADLTGTADALLAGAGGSPPQSPTGKRKYTSVQEAAKEEALRKLGEPSWQAFSRKVLAAASQREAAGQAAGRGGRGGKGRGRKGGGRGAGAAEEELSIVDVLNKNSRVYHERFAAAYREAKEKLEKHDAKRLKQEALKQASEAAGRWSDLTAQEHAWYLQHQGQPLAGPEAKRMELLQPRVAHEQREYMAHVQQQAAGTASGLARYSHLTERQGAQLDADAARRKQQLRQRLPRCYRLRATLRVPWPVSQPDAPATGQQAAGGALPLRHVASLREQGPVPAFAVPDDGSSIPGDKIYLPCTIGAAGGTGGATGSTTGVYRKAEVSPLAEDALLAELVQQAQQQRLPQTQAQQQQQQEDEGQGLKIQQESHQQDKQQERAGEQQQQDSAPADAAPQPTYSLAASALAALVATPMLERRPGWEIPVTIQSLSAGKIPSAEGVPAAPAPGEGSVPGQPGQLRGSDSGMLICLEKPLLPRSMALRAKQERLHKYAVLSLGIQQGKEVEKQQQKQLGHTPGRTRRSTRAAAAVAPAGMPPQATAQGEGLPARQAAYDCWQLGACRLLVRSHGVMALGGERQQAGEQQQQQEQQQEQPSDGPQQQEEEPQRRRAVLAVTSEYLPETDLEDTTSDELVRWWLRLLLRPAADTLLVAHVHVPKGRLLCCEELTAADLEQRLRGGSRHAEQAPAGQLAAEVAPAGHQADAPSRMRQLASSGLSFLQQLLGTLAEQPAGRYLLTHAPGDPSCCLFRALPPELEASLQDEAHPLPSSAVLARQDTIYDLHAAHHRSGATDFDADSFRPPRWKPSSPDVPQIPYTFPPKLGQQQGRPKAKARQRKGVPHAWLTLGEGGDFDQVGHVAQISKADYMQGLEEELF